MCIKINNYQAIAILWKQKFQQTPQKHQILRGKPSGVEGKNNRAALKNIHYEIEITTVGAG